MKQILLMSAALVALLSGCNVLDRVRGSQDTATPSVDPTDPCNAKAYSQLLGASIAATTLPDSLNHRVLAADGVATTDYDPTRLNFELDGNSTIIGLSCG